MVIGRQGIITNIQRFSLDDGPGIRTTVFFKGCNLRCLWCHNPETIDPDVELALMQDRCIRCGNCAVACRHSAQTCNPEDRHINRTACVRCMECVTACATGALSAYGRPVRAEQLMKEVLRDRAFYGKSGGGVTFSGGEPMLQPDFLLEMLIACREQGLHTAVDTAGNVPFDRFRMILPYTDLFLYDIKAMDAALHREITGADNGLIRENLTQLGRIGASIWVRLPFIPGLNNTEREVTEASAFLSTIQGIERVELLPYHPYGQSKYDAIGLANHYPGGSPPEKKDILTVIAAYEANGLNVKCPSME